MTGFTSCGNMARFDLTSFSDGELVATKQTDKFRRVEEDAEVRNY